MVTSTVEVKIRLRFQIPTSPIVKMEFDCFALVDVQVREPDSKGEQDQ